MKSFSFPARVIILFLILVVAGMAPTTHAQINFGSGFDSTKVCTSPPPTTTFAAASPCLIQTNGTASVPTGTTSVLRLTTNVGGQDGSAWYTSPQNVQNGFTTTFQFRFTNPSAPPADGIAFVIQNSTSGVNALGGGGGSIGYGGTTDGSNVLNGIANSLAIEFDTYNNGSGISDPNANHVAVQSCGAGANSSWHIKNCDGTSVAPGAYGTSNLGIQPNLPVTLSDGNYHTVTIQYNAFNATTPAPCAPAVSSTNNLCIYIDQTASPILTVKTDLSALGLNLGNAFVGFTAATGYFYETHDILNWTFTTPTQMQTQTIVPGTTNTFTFNGTTGAQIVHTVTFPSGITTSAMLQSQNFLVSNSTSWPPYVVGTPFATSQLFIKSGANSPGSTTDYGSIFKDVCSITTTSGTTTSDANCPVGSTTSPILITDKSDLVSQPAIAAGTTVALIRYVPNQITTQTDWNPAPAGTSPNPVCFNVLGTAASPTASACDLANILVNFTGDATTSSGTTPKKGTFATVYNVPMPTTAPKVNGIPVNPVAPIFVRSPLSFDFVVTPAQVTPVTNNFVAAPVANLFYALSTNPPALPNPITPNCAGTNCAVIGATQPGTSSIASVEFASISATSAADGTYLLQWSAGDTVGIRELKVALTATTNANCPDGSPATPFGKCYSTSLFSAPVVVDTTAPTITGPTLSTPSATSTTITATYSCQDALSGVVSCGSVTPASPVVAPATVNGLDTLPITTGAHTFSITATDAAGNVATSPTVTYTVYGICALYDQGKAVKSGATIPIKMYLCNSGVDVSSSSLIVHATGLWQASSSTSDPVIDTGTSNPDNDFRYDSGQGPSGGYIFNLKTTGLGSGNWVMQFTVTGDPTLHTLQFGIK